jgi:hypothetical protein
MFSSIKNNPFLNNLYVVSTTVKKIPSISQYGGNKKTIKINSNINGKIVIKEIPSGDETPKAPRSPLLDAFEKGKTLRKVSTQPAQPAQQTETSLTDHLRDKLDKRRTAFKDHEPKPQAQAQAPLQAVVVRR